MRPNLRTSLKSFMSLPTQISELQLVGKEAKLVLCFYLKDKNLYPSCKIHYEKCKQCGEDYVGETKRNCTTSWGEHDNPTHKSEPANHINIMLNTNLNGVSFVTPQYRNI